MGDSSDKAGRNRCAWAFGLALVLGVVAAYSNHFHNDFHFDDSHAVVNNAFIRELRNIPRFFVDATLFSSLPANQSYRPIVSATLAIDYWLGGKLDPFWFHLSIFLWFVVLGLMLGFVTYRLLEAGGSAPQNIWLAILAGGWFGLHPANADTVNYVIARSDVLSTVAVVGSLAMYLAFPGSRRAHLYVLPAAIGILAKPIAVVFVPLFAAYVWLLGRRERPAWREMLPVVLVCGAASWLVQVMTPKTWAAGAVGTHQYLITQPYVVWLYFKTFFWPVGLSADYDLNPFHSINDCRFWAGLGFVALYLTGMVMAMACRRTRVVGFGLLWFLLALLPTSLWPLAEVMNSHRTFLAYAGLIIAIAGLASWFLTLRPAVDTWVRTVAVCAVSIFLCANGYATYERNRVWKTEESLWRDVTIKSPQNGRGLMNYGLALMAKGDFKQALDYFHRAQRLTPLYSTLFINLAIAEAAMGDRVKAEADFKEALRLAPKNPGSYTYYARWLLSRSRQTEATELLGQALELSPGDLFAQDLMNLAKNHSTSIPELTSRNTVAGAEGYLNLSLQHYNAKRYAEAIAAAEQALQLRPGYAEAYNNICAAHNQLGQYEKAVAAGEQALRNRPNFPLASNNLQYARQQLNSEARSD